MVRTYLGNTHLACVDESTISGILEVLSVLEILGYAENSMASLTSILGKCCLWGWLLPGIKELGFQEGFTILRAGKSGSLGLKCLYKQYALYEIPAFLLGL